MIGEQRTSDYSLITTKLIEPFKAQVFVAHVKNHLDRGEYGVVDPINPLRRIPIGMVGCKICEKGIDQVYEEERTLYDAKVREGEKK